MNLELWGIKNSNMKIIVTGSLGHIGRPLTQKLVQGGHHVTVVSSNADRIKDIELLGARAAVGSLEDVPFLSGTIAGADAVYTMLPPQPFAEPDASMYGRRLGDHYATAIREAGIRRVVHLSSWGADLDRDTGFILCAHAAEKELDKLVDVGIVFLRPCSFFYNLLGFIPMIKATGLITCNYGEADRLVLVAPEDIADAAAEELVNADGAGQDGAGPDTAFTDTARPDQNRRRIRYVASEETTCNEVAHVLGEHIGKPDLLWKRVTDEQMRTNLLNNGLPEHVAANIVDLGSASRRGLLRQGYDLHKPVLGKTKLKDFAQTFALQFNQQ